jgi:hypothetical protein
LDDFPLRVLCRLGVCGYRKLARATTVYGGSHESDGLRLSGVPHIHTAGNAIEAVGAGSLLAWEVLGSQRRIGEGCIIKRLRVQHNHVCAGTGSEGYDKGGCGEHVDLCCSLAEIWWQLCRSRWFN